MIHWWILIGVWYLITVFLIVKVRKYYREVQELEELFEELNEKAGQLFEDFIEEAEKYNEINGFKVSELPNNPHKMIEEEGEIE